MKINFIKKFGQFIPASNDDQSKIIKLPADQLIECNIKTYRNPGFHRKYFALIDLAFEAWEPGGLFKGQPIQKNKERFRDDLTILAGFYDVTFKIDGTPIMQAKSISFATMDQPEFEDLYNKTIDVVLNKVLKNYSRDDIYKVIDKILGFA